MIIQGVTLTGVAVYDGVVYNGLQLYLDANNTTSYPGTEYNVALVIENRIIV